MANCKSSLGCSEFQIGLEKNFYVKGFEACNIEHMLMILLGANYKYEGKESGVTLNKIISDTRGRFSEWSESPYQKDHKFPLRCWLCPMHGIPEEDESGSVVCHMGNKSGRVKSSDCLLFYFLTNLFTFEFQLEADSLGKKLNDLTMRDLTTRFLYR